MKGIQRRVWIALLIMVLALTGCSKEEKKEVKKEQDAEATGVVENTQENETEPIEESRPELTLEQIQALSEEGVYLLYCYNQEREYNAGMSFAIESARHGKVLLKDAFRLWPYDGEVLEPEKLPGFVWGGELWDTETGDGLNVFLKNCFLLKYKHEAIDKNVAAFTLQGEGEVKALTLATDMPKVEDKVYLLAGEQVYEGKVEGILLKEFTYSFEGLGEHPSGFLTGAPIVNVYGEVIGSYLGTSETEGVLSYFGIELVGFGDKIEQADVSDITYPTVFIKDFVSSIFPNTKEFTGKQRIESYYSDILIHGAYVTDELEGHRPKDGYKYLALEMTFVNSPNVTESIQTYYGDFKLEWPNHERVSPETEELMYGQFPKDFVITDDETRGVMIFQVPEDRIRARFTFVEAYPKEGSDVMETMYNMVYIPLENWTR